MAKYKATGRPRGPFFGQAALLKPPTESSEAAAARALQLERDRRAGACLAELLALLQRHRCGLQVVVQDIMIPGQAGSQRVCQVNVVPLDTPESPTPAPAGSSDNGGKPAA